MKCTFRITISGLIALMAFSASLSHAAPGPVVVYNFNDPTDPRAASQVAPNITASQIGQVNLPSVNWYAQDGSLEFASTPHTDIPTPNDIPPSLTDYFTFTLSPNTGHQIDFTSLTLNASTGYGTGSNSGSDTVLTILLYSLDINNVPSLLSSSTPPTQLVNQSNNFAAFAFTFPTLPPVTEPTEFRLYVYDAGNNTATRSFRLDDVVVNGEVESLSFAPVPEPTTALFGLALCGVIGFSRRRISTRVAVLNNCAA